MASAVDIRQVFVSSPVSAVSREQRDLLDRHVEPAAVELEVAIARWTCGVARRELRARWTGVERGLDDGPRCDG